MSHQGGEVPRLVCVQGAVSPSDASVPLYRHPADEAPPLVPFSPTVLKIKEHVERHVGHELNHVLVQLYRSGQDYISEHSDKTLDVVKGSFRQIGTFLDKDGLLIWGQGATGKTRADAKPVKNGASEAEQMIRAFGVENNTPDFDWDAVYGQGFDVLHFKAVPRLWESGDETRDLRVKLMLGSYGVGFAIGDHTHVDGETTAAKELRFLDNDADKSDFRGDLAVMLYLESTYGKLSAGKTGSLATRLTRFERAMSLLDKWRATGDPELKPLEGELAVFDGHMSSGAEYVAGGEAPSLADFALWPVLREMAGLVGSGQGGKGKNDESFSGLLEGMGLSRLSKYYERFGREKFVGRVVEE